MESPIKSYTILIVDDDPDYLLQQQLVLTAAGYTVASASGVKEATALLDIVKPDLAVLDLMMEEVDGGFSLAYRIKKRYPGTPVIIVTAVASETGLEFDAVTEDERAWTKADLMLAKPVRGEQLKHEIARLLRIEG